MKTKVILCCSLLCAVGSVRAISPISNKNQVKTEVSPQLEAMMRYDKTDVAMCSGRINQTIPLIRFDDPDFDFPIAVSYSGSGFRPMLADNITGLHWTLDAGGVIYRDIKGVPDDAWSYFCDKRGQGKDRIKGFTSVTSLGYNNQTKANELMTDPGENLFVGDFNSLSIEQYATFAGTNIEASSDIYNFNFCGHSGRFMINFDGSVSVMSTDGRKYKVDLSRYSGSEYNRNYKSELRIITDDGYIYCFGGDLSAMEYTALSWQDYVSPSSNETQQNQIVAFYLNRIVAPNGRELIIRYKNTVPDEYHDNPSRLRGFTPAMAATSPYTSNYKVMYRYTDKTTNYQSVNYTLQKVALISKIETDLVTVDFSYSTIDALPVNTVFDFAKACPGQRLDAVEMNSVSGGLLDKSELGYEYSIPNKRLFLKSVQNLKSGKYGFNYRINATIPSTLTSNIDYWGFWRGTPENNSLKPAVDATYNPIIATDNTREPTLEAYDLTLLSDIIFPTGGHAHFQYEPHTYYQIFGQAFPFYTYGTSSADTNFCKFTGGARIKNIRYYDGWSNVVKEKCYQYSSDKEGRMSTGTLMCNPTFALRETADWNNCQPTLGPVVFSPNNFKQSPAFSDLVQYETVREYDVSTLGKDISTDSLFLVGISPLSQDRSIEATVQIGNVYQEFRYGKWTIWGKPHETSKGRSRILIYNEQGKLVWERIFSQAGVEETEEFNPVSKFGNGTFRIVLEADPMARINFQSFYRFAKAEHFDGPYRETKFTTIHTNPDLNTCKYFVSNPQTQIYIETNIPGNSCWWASNPWLVKYYLADPDDRSHERGKVLSVKYFSNDDVLLRTDSYKYDRFASQDVVWVNAPALEYYKMGLGFYSYVNKQNFNSYLPVEKTTVIFDPQTALELLQSETYTYAADGYLEYQTQSHTDGSATRQSYECVGKASVQTPAYQAMQRRNMEWSPLRVTESVSPDRVDFQPVKKTEYTYDLSALRDTLSPIPVCTATAESFPGSTTENKIEYLVYDCYGNPAHVLVNGTLSTVYIWGCSGKYLVAKIENASYEEVQNKLGATYLAEFPKQQTPALDQIDALRTQLPNAQVSTFTYVQGRGVTAVTSPAGQTTEYIYDASGHLSQIGLITPNGMFQLLKNYDYHLLNQ